MHNPVNQMGECELTKGGAQAKQAVSPGTSNCIWPETASSETPERKPSCYINSNI